MKKLKINFKLTAFLVSLFIGLLLVILGSKNEYCLSFGFIITGFSIELFLWYINENTENEINQINKEIDEIDVADDIGEEEKAYILKQLYIRQKKLIKKKSYSKFSFSICGVLLVILGFAGLF